jgi:hypothetical protein
MSSSTQCIVTVHSAWHVMPYYSSTNAEGFFIAGTLLEWFSMSMFHTFMYNCLPTVGSRLCWERQCSSAVATCTTLFGFADLTALNVVHAVRGPGLAAIHVARATLAASRAVLVQCCWYCRHWWLYAELPAHYFTAVGSRLHIFAVCSLTHLGGDYFHFLICQGRCA